MKKLFKLTVCRLLALGLCNCARFTTKQSDIRYESGKPATTITTRVSAWTFWEAKSLLTQFKAAQTDKSQSANVGSLEQAGGGVGTNAVRVIDGIVEILKQVK